MSGEPSPVELVPPSQAEQTNQPPNHTPLPQSISISPEAQMLMRSLKAENEARNGGSTQPPDFPANATKLQVPEAVRKDIERRKVPGLLGYIKSMGLEETDLPPDIQREIGELETVSDKDQFAARVSNLFGQIKPILLEKLPVEKRADLESSYKAVQEGIESGRITADMIYNELKGQAGEAMKTNPDITPQEVDKLTQEIKDEFAKAKPSLQNVEKKAEGMGLKGIIKTIMMILLAVTGFGVFKGATSE